MYPRLRCRGSETHEWSHACYALRHRVYSSQRVLSTFAYVDHGADQTSFTYAVSWTSVPVLLPRSFKVRHRRLPTTRKPSLRQPDGDHLTVQGQHEILMGGPHHPKHARRRKMRIEDSAGLYVKLTQVSSYS
jgi:hypothetical protein